MRRLLVLVSFAYGFCGCGSTSSGVTGAGDDAGTGVGATSAPSDVACADAPDGGVGADGVPLLCGCKVTTTAAGGKSAEASYSGDYCWEDHTPAATCCAGDDYPGSGACDCAKSAAGPWTCSNGSNNTCQCSFTASGGASVPCTTVTASGLPASGGAAPCYASQSGERCYCTYGNKAEATDTPVATCDGAHSGGSLCSQGAAECNCAEWQCYTSNGVCNCQPTGVVLAGTLGACNIPSQHCCVSPSSATCQCSASATSCSSYGPDYVSVADCNAATIDPLIGPNTYLGKAVSACTGLGGSGTASICCADTTSCTCHIGTVCDFPSTQVPDCSTPELAKVPLQRVACPTGSHAIDSCSQGLTPPPPTTSAGDAGAGGGGGCDPEECVDGTGCYCDGPLNSKASKCVCPDP